MTTQIPFFPGFYNTVLDDYISQEEEREIEAEAKDPSDEAYNASEVKVRDKVNYPAARSAITRAWVNEFSELVNINLTYKSLWSPREYNFLTDKAIAEIAVEDVRMMHKRVHGDGEFRSLFVDVIKQWFTSRSGFHSFFPNDIEYWEAQDPETLCGVSISAYLAAYVMGMTGETQAQIEKDIEGEPRVYEAADALWTPKPNKEEP